MSGRRIFHITICTFLSLLFHDLFPCFSFPAKSFLSLSLSLLRYFSMFSYPPLTSPLMTIKKMERKEREREKNLNQNRKETSYEMQIQRLNSKRKRGSCYYCGRCEMCCFHRSCFLIVLPDFPNDTLTILIIFSLSLPQILEQKYWESLMMIVVIIIIYCNVIISIYDRHPHQVMIEIGSNFIELSLSLSLSFYVSPIEHSLICSSYSYLTDIEIDRGWISFSFSDPHQS